MVYKPRTGETPAPQPGCFWEVQVSMQAYLDALGFGWTFPYHPTDINSAMKCPAQGAHLLQVAGRARGDLSITKDDLLGSTAAESTHDAGEDLLLADEGGVLPWHKPGQTTRLASGD